MTSKQEIRAIVTPILKQLNSTSAEVEASAIMSRNGRCLASILGPEVDSVKLGALCEKLLPQGEKGAKDLKRGKIRQVLIDADEGYILLQPLGDKTVLAVLSRPSASLGIVLMEAKRTASEIVALGCL